MSLKVRLPLVILAVLAVCLAAGAFFLWPHLEGDAPLVQLSPQITHLKKEAKIKINLSDPGMGLARVRVRLDQNGKSNQIAEEIYPTSGGSRGPAQASLEVDIRPRDLGYTDGRVTMVVEVADRSFRGWLAGNETRIELPLVIDTVPPQITNLSHIIYLNPGGAGLAVYQVDDVDSRHGVQVGEAMFSGVAPWPERPQARMCYFACPLKPEKNIRINIWALDQAGNLTTAPLNIHLRGKLFKADRIGLSDRFLAEVEPRFAGEYPPDRTDPLARFKWVNEELRENNHKTMQEASAQTEAYQLWKGTFLRPPGKPTAGFGDQRTYLYNDNEATHSLHLGVDLAHTANSPVPAVADGIVRFTGALGIYGNAVIIDHGQGLATLYGHLSEISVNSGQALAKGDTIGRSGATGLALGDHLHFSILVSGVFVNPGEWWDPHWIDHNVKLRFSEAGLPMPFPPAASTPAAQGGKS